jgi:hypothetical protein
MAAKVRFVLVDDIVRDFIRPAPRLPTQASQTLILQRQIDLRLRLL